MLYTATRRELFQKRMGPTVFCINYYSTAIYYYERIMGSNVEKERIYLYLLLVHLRCMRIHTIIVNTRTSSISQLIK